MSLDVDLECGSCGTSLFCVNVTHNLTQMAREAGLYLFLWRPDEVGITQAGQLIEPLTVGLDVLEDDPEHFDQFAPDNGWGSYHNLHEAVVDLLEQATEYPDARVRISR